MSGRGLRALVGSALLAVIASLVVLPSVAEGAEVSRPTVELLVSTEPGADYSAIGEIVEASTARGVAHRPDLSVLRIEAARVAEVTEQLESRTDVAFAAPVAVARMAAANDPLLARQWHLADRSRYAGSANWAPVGNGTLGAGAVVAVLDTGVTPHSDLDGLLQGIDLVDGDSNASDPHGHGTHVAGTVAESTGNGLGAAGVAPGASLLPVRVLDASGSAPYDRIFSALAYATEQGADVINLSLAGPTDAGICDAVSRAVAAGVVVIAAAGNDAGPVAYPAACSDAIGISAVSQTALVASYSNRGSQVDLAAPGGEPADLNFDGDPDGVLQYSVFNNTPGYYYSSGTSMAAPHVAGAAAIVRSVRPNSTPAQVRQVLLSTATDIGVPGTDAIYGAGLLDVAAVSAAANALPVSSAPSPTPTPAPAPSPEPAPSPQPSPSPTPATDPSPAPEQPAPSTSSPTGGSAVQRASGADRFATAAAISAQEFPSGVRHVWVATGASFADALAAGAAAGRQNGPLLLVEGCGVPEATAGELARLRPASVTVVGGPSAVCDGVIDHLRSLTGVNPGRVAGPDRSATAAGLSQALWSNGSATAVVASGATYADALGGGALAARLDAPLLLTGSCELPGATAGELDRLRPTRVIVLGGAGAVCDSVVQAISARTGATVERVSGANRFSTAAAAAQLGWPAGAPRAFVASGGSFADGLAAGAAAASSDAPLLLVPSCGNLPSEVRTAVERLAISSATIAGGEAAVCTGVAQELSALIS